VKVFEMTSDSATVERIGAFSEQQKVGHIPLADLQMLPITFVPKHVLLAELLIGRTVSLPHIDIVSKSLSIESPYYDAGANSKRLEPDDRLKVKDIMQEFASVNLMDVNGSNIGYGKIHTCHLLNVKADSNDWQSPSVYSTPAVQCSVFTRSSVCNISLLLLCMSLVMSFLRARVHDQYSQFATLV
jgi:hypothetical protein